jgi:hypothetical protein
MTMEMRAGRACSKQRPARRVSFSELLGRLLRVERSPDCFQGLAGHLGTGLTRIVVFVRCSRPRLVGGVREVPTEVLVVALDELLCFVRHGFRIHGNVRVLALLPIVVGEECLIEVAVEVVLTFDPDEAVAFRDHSNIYRASHGLRLKGHSSLERREID